ncbi:hypothetical protein HU200_055152 [Digitaria exilis]|uniref:At4g15545-like C-terminal domain-containing protein n=1 Tax=Digitaria exilis TaxID=1010633 RepID=A0A835ATP5_9POAL|nr:hypothetical protein HU200_055152 [Digitaria exilis]
MTQTPTPAASTATASQPPGPEPAPAPAAGLPDAIAAALPPDPYEQLEVARKITAVAVAARASRLELEAARLRQRLADRDRVAAGLADRAARLELALRDADARLRTALDDNAKLAKERDSLAQTTKKLARDLAKVTAFLKVRLVAVTNSFKASVSKWPHSSVASDVLCCVHPLLRTVTRPFEQKLTITHITPRLTSDPAPKLRTAATSPRRYSTAVSPKLTSGATSPRLEGHMAMSPWLPSSKMSSAANSPPRGRSISGNTELLLIFAYTAAPQETLRKADEIFGAENKDLFMSFQGLLSRSLS